MPNRTYNNKNPKFYDDHSRGSNIGFRKHGAFGNENVLFGFEYTRLLQSIYYNIIPSSNWYDNIKYNYSAFRGRRWAAHSGTDSDDFIFYGGLLNDKYSAILGWNYERHGAGNHFPPEVKLESRFSFSVKIKSMWLYIYYEDEYFEHYGFVDDNLNVWTETFEKGSIQRTKTLLFSIEYRIN